MPRPSRLMPRQRPEVGPRPPAASPAREAGTGRLAGVDGLRAFAAIWVVLFHMRSFSGGALWPGVDLVLRSGSTGVSLFLVLSGFCLYLPYAGDRLDRFRTGAFMRRRCARLLPTYYASLALIVLAQLVLGGHGDLPRLGGPELARQTVAHATLTHQFFPSTFYALNGAYWSLGLEWQLYLTLPLLVLGARRFGLARTVAAVFAVTIAYRLLLFAAVAGGILPGQSTWATVVLPNLLLGRWSEFALGMVAAALYRTGRTGARARQLGAAAVLAAAAGLLLSANPLKHVLFGLVFFTLLCAVLSGDNVVARVFAWRPLVAIGVMSYSLYLVHQPLVGSLGLAFGAGTGTDPRRVFLLLLATFPLILLVGLALFATVEWRSIARRGSTRVPLRQLLFPPVRAAAPAAPAVLHPVPAAAPAGSPATEPLVLERGR
ncbi:MAG: acyltransferase family protein [Mycobacteriales bacterium]